MHRLEIIASAPYLANHSLLQPHQAPSLTGRPFLKRTKISLPGCMMVLRWSHSLNSTPLFSKWRSLKTYNNKCKIELIIINLIVHLGTQSRRTWRSWQLYKEWDLVTIKADSQWMAYNHSSSFIHLSSNKWPIKRTSLSPIMGPHPRRMQVPVTACLNKLRPKTATIRLSTLFKIRWRWGALRTITWRPTMRLVGALGWSCRISKGMQVW